MTRSRDTSPEASRRQLEIYRSMSPSERLRIAASITDEVRALTEAGISKRHPTWSAEQRIAEMVRIARRRP